MRDFAACLREAGEEHRMLEHAAERERRRKRARKKRGQAFLRILPAAFLLAALLAAPTAAGEAERIRAGMNAPDSVDEPWEVEQQDFENARIEQALKERAVHVGSCRVSFYTCCALECGNDSGITASGVRATPEVSAAVDPSVIPLGCDVLLKWQDGTEQWCRSDDTGSAIVGKRIDLCVAERTDALNRGVVTADVYYIPKEG